MNFCERDYGPYRIYAAALEAPERACYVAAVVVGRRGGTVGEPLEAFRDTRLANGFPWPSPDDALRFAIVKARSAACLIAAWACKALGLPIAGRRCWSRTEWGSHHEVRLRARSCEAVAATVRRKYLQLTVTSDYPPGEPDGYELDIKGGTKAERDAAMAWAKKYAERLTYKPTRWKRIAAPNLPTATSAASRAEACAAWVGVPPKAPVMTLWQKLRDAYRRQDKFSLGFGVVSGIILTVAGKAARPATSPRETRLEPC
jgi:hypothetical protein